MFTRTTIVRMILAFFVLVVVEVRGDVILPGEPIPEPNFKPDEIIVKFDTAVADSLAEQLAAGEIEKNQRLKSKKQNTM